VKIQLLGWWVLAVQLYKYTVFTTCNAGSANLAIIYQTCLKRNYLRENMQKQEVV